MQLHSHHATIHPVTERSVSKFDVNFESLSVKGIHSHPRTSVVCIMIHTTVCRIVQHHAIDASDKG